MSITVLNNHRDQSNLQAGNIAFHLSAWKEITSDRTILEMVKGYNIEIIESCEQTCEPKTIPFSKEENDFMHSEIQKLLEQKVIEVSNEEKYQFMSNVFLRPKKDGSFRMILNLINFNSTLPYHHFKMDSVQTCICLVTPGVFMASLDLKDAYYSVPVSLESRKFLKFRWNNTLYQYTCLPNGLCSAPRIFTKLMKPVLSYLRAQGFLCSIYLDDLYLQGDIFTECTEHTIRSETPLKTWLCGTPRKI